MFIAKPCQLTVHDENGKLVICDHVCIAKNRKNLIRNQNRHILRHRE